MKCRRAFKKTVAAKSVEYYDWVVPAGRRWRLGDVFGTATMTGDTRVEITWDRKNANPVVLFMTYGTSNVSLKDEMVGDGVKAVSIALYNESSRPAVLFAWFLCEEMEPREADGDLSPEARDTLKGARVHV